MTKPLADIRVLDFSKVLAGPLCTQYLADMGADVIKVEPEGVGDDTRAWPPFRAPGLGAVFLSVNRGKRSVTLDLKTESGRRAILELARTADVVVESYGNGVVERLGIDEASIRKVNPDVVYCSISGFGRNGPMKDAPGYDVILQAFCGVMSLTGEEGGSHRSIRARGCMR
jgi:crotonobetainyl-CoA:carnitine CoA-transferase CaiB-like acyl-CoA transferase